MKAIKKIVLLSSWVFYAGACVFHAGAFDYSPEYYHPREYKKKYDAAQLKELQDINKKFQEFGQLVVELHRLEDHYHGEIYCETQDKVDASWPRLKSDVMNVVKQHGIHPDDIGAPRNCRLLWECIEFSDVPFTKFLLTHGADPNAHSYLTEPNITIPIAFTMITHGADVRSMCEDDCLQGLRSYNKHSPDLALLYFCAGASATLIDNRGRNPLIKLAEEVVQGICLNPAQKGTYWHTFGTSLKLAENLIKIGVSLDCRISKEYVLFGNHFRCEVGDDVWKILEKGSHVYMAGPGHERYNTERHACIEVFKNTLTRAKKEVDEEQEKYKNCVQSTLEPHIRAGGVRSLVYAYAQEHRFPPSVLEDIRKLPKETRIFTDRFLKKCVKE